MVSEKGQFLESVRDRIQLLDLRQSGQVFHRWHGTGQTKMNDKDYDSDGTKAYEQALKEIEDKKNFIKKSQRKCKKKRERKPKEI